MSELPHILCVDDEPKVLEGLGHVLRRHFRVSTAVHGQAGLAIVEGDDPPVVVISDMCMPEMDGTAFLSLVRERSPDSVRLLLTGRADVESAIAAVNHGQIFRFLMKPCDTPILIGAVSAAVEQHRLITSERVLLEQTLRACVRTLIDLLSLANPLAFGRAIRLKQQSVELLEALGLPVAWHIEVATMLSQLGCIGLPAATCAKLYYGRSLTPREVEVVQRLPRLAAQMIESLPRLDAVRAILENETNNFDGSGSPEGAAKGEAIPVGARVLRIVSDYDVLEASGCSLKEAVDKLMVRKGRYDPKLLEAFIHLRAQPPARARCEIDLETARPGMLLAQEISSASGQLLAARGQQLTTGLLQRLRNLPAGTVREPFTVLVANTEQVKP